MKLRTVTRDELQAIAWRDFITWAWSEPKMRQAFEDDTGLKMLSAPTSPLEFLIDQATRAPEAKASEYVQGFVGWVMLNHWGLDEAPAAYRKELVEKPKLGLAFPKK